MHTSSPNVYIDLLEEDQQNTYAVSAEFYDLLQAERDEARVRRLYSGDVVNARLGVLDVGAGTGRVTLMSLMESQVPVHAVEPTRAMRSPLMTRLASLPADLRMRVTVHPHTLDAAGLHEVADVAICHNTVAAFTRLHGGPCGRPSPRRSCPAVCCSFSSHPHAFRFTRPLMSFRRRGSACTSTADAWWRRPT